MKKCSKCKSWNAEKTHLLLGLMYYYIPVMIAADCPNNTYIMSDEPKEIYVDGYKCSSCGFEWKEKHELHS